MSAIVLSLWRIFSNTWRHRYLLGQLIKRDLLLRYRDAMCGVDFPRPFVDADDFFLRFWSGFSDELAATN